MQNSQHLATIDIHCGAIKTVEGRLEEVKIKHQDLEAERQALVGQCDEWSVRNKALDASLQASEAQKQTLGIQYAEQLTTTDALHSEIEILKGLMKKAEITSEAQRQDLVGQNSEYAARIDALKETLGENERKLEEVRAMYAEQAVVAESLSKRLPAVEDQLNETEIKLRESEAQRAALVMQNSQHLATIDDHSSVIKSVEGQLEEAKMKHEDLGRTHVEKCDEWSAMNRALDASLQASEAQKQTLGMQYAEQLTTTDALHSEIEVLKGLLNGAETKSEAQQDDFVRQTSEHGARIGALKETLAENERKLEEVKAMYAEQVVVAENLSTKLPAIEDRLNETEIKLQESEAQRTVLITQNSRHLAIIDDHSTTIKIVEGQLEEAKMKHQDLEAQRRTHVEKCDEWSARHRELDARFTETDASLQASEAQRHTLGMRYAEQLSATDALRAELEVLKDLLKEAGTKSEAQRQDFVDSEHTSAVRIGALEQTIAENERKLEEFGARYVEHVAAVSPVSPM